MVTDDDYFPGQRYYSMLCTSMERDFPWLLIQNPALMFSKQGTNMVRSVLYRPAVLYDVVRMLEVARTVMPGPMFCTWFNMVKFVVPNLDAKLWCKTNPEEAVRLMSLPPGRDGSLQGPPPEAMTSVMLRQQELLHPWLLANGYKRYHPDEMTGNNNVRVCALRY